jgi:hypothetical protein
MRCSTEAQEKGIAVGRKAILATLVEDTSDMDARQLRQTVTKAFGQSHFELRRDGSTPLMFKGRKLAEVTSYTAGTSIWYELAAYSTGDGFAAAIKVFKKCEQEKDLFSADRFSSLAELSAHFETYDPTHDVVIRDDLTDSRLSNAEAMIKAAALRQRMAEARSEYRAAAGEILTELSRLDV